MAALWDVLLNTNDRCRVLADITIAISHKSLLQDCREFISKKKSHIALNDLNHISEHIHEMEEQYTYISNLFGNNKKNHYILRKKKLKKQATLLRIHATWCTL